MTNLNKHFYQAIVFDLDGTLLDSWPCLLNTVRRVALTGERALHIDALRLKLSEGIAPMFELAVEQIGLGAAAARAAIAAMQQQYVRHELVYTRAYESVGNVLAYATSAGARLAVCTNRDRESTQSLLSLMGWSGYFSHVQCWGDGLAAKPDPEPLLATLVQLNCPVQEALFVGDSGVDALCAKYAGVDFVVHSGGYHSDLEELQPAVLRYERASQLQQWLQGRINAGTVEN